MLLTGSLGCSVLPQRSPQAEQDRAVAAAGKFESSLSLARLHERHGQVESARQVYEAILEQDAANGLANHRLAVIAARQRRFDQADRHFQQALAGGSPSSELLADVGYFDYLQDRLPEAEQKFRQALELDGGNRAARTNLALVLGEQGRLEEAFAEFRRAGGEAQAHANLAYVCALLGDMERAESEYHRALALDPQLKPAAEALAQIGERRRALRPQRTNVRREQQVASTIPRRLPAPRQPDPLIASVAESPALPSPVIQASWSEPLPPRPAAAAPEKPAGPPAMAPIANPAAGLVKGAPAPWAQPTWTPSSPAAP
jgi:Tfp pilus assembly protein PilF